MKRVNKLIAAATLLAFIGVPLSGAAENKAKSYTGSTQFEQMKTLVGTWQGTSSRNKDDKVTVKYHLTSGGSAIVETLFPGAPYEMITVYHDQKGNNQFNFRSIALIIKDNHVLIQKDLKDDFWALPGGRFPGLPVGRVERAIPGRDS